MTTPYYLPKKRGALESTLKISLFLEAPQFAVSHTYYLVDLGYAISTAFLTPHNMIPYPGISRCEQASYNPAKIFNYRHLSL